jgi:splicing factor 3A subunit 2
MGGTDMQNRGGGKTGTYGIASSQQEAIDRRERLRKLALETIDIKKDPYFMRNHIGQYECKLCLTIHTNEGNYLAHTQGKRHQDNLGRRAAKEAAEKASTAPASSAAGPVIRTIKIGRPGYKVIKQRDPNTNQKSLLFEIEYPQINQDLQPRHRFMSAFEQHKEPAEKGWQYLLFAAEPYETIAFKIPSLEIDRDPEKFFSVWNADTKVFTLQVTFK